MSALERRFDRTRLPEEALAEFHTARQKPDESLVEWADRLQSFAVQAFGTNYGHGTTQLVLQLCQGCIDKAAG